MDTVIFAILAFVPMLLLLVVIHEWGHFATAKAFGVKVMEFGIGYPPRAWGFYTGQTAVLLDGQTQLVGVESAADLRPGQYIRLSSTADAAGNLVARRIEVPPPGARRRQSSLQETGNDEYLQHEGKVRQAGGNALIVADMLWSLNWLPLGGFVRLAGENNPATPRSLAAKGPGPRAVILAAGSVMNAIFPIVAFTLLFMLPQQVTVGRVAVTEVADNSPALAAGIRPGDVIAQAGGRDIEQGSDLVRITTLRAGSEMEWQVERAGRTDIIRLTPRINPPLGQGATGIRIDLIEPRTETRWAPPWQAVPRAFSSTWEMLTLLRQEISAWVTGARAPQLSGPVGIAQVTGEVTQEGGLRSWVLLSILFSINLAILNLLPIPMLDGGRLVFVALEWVRGGKRIPPEREGMVHLIGFIVLIGLIVVITYQDILRIAQGGSVLGG